VENNPPSVLRPAIEPALELSGSDLFWENHWKKFAWGLAGIVVLILAVGAWKFWSQQVRASAESLLSEASTPEEWQAVVERYPGTTAAGNARLLLAENLRQNGDLTGAVRELEAMIAAQPAHPLVGAAWLTLGGVRQLEGSGTEALEAYRTASSRFPESYTAPLALVAEGRLLVEQGSPGEARAVWQSVAALYPDTPSAMVAAGELARLGPGADAPFSP